MKLYRSYFFREKDPIIDVMRTLVEDSGKTYSKVADLSGVTAGTLRNWFGGTTRRPQFATVAAVAQGLGKGIRFGNTNVFSWPSDTELAALDREEKKKKKNGKA